MQLMLHSSGALRDLTSLNALTFFAFLAVISCETALLIRYFWPNAEVNRPHFAIFLRKCKRLFYARPFLLIFCTISTKTLDAISKYANLRAQCKIKLLEYRYFCTKKEDVYWIVRKY